MTFSESSLHGSLKIGQAKAPVLGLPSGAQLHRLFRRPDADWVPAPPAYREGRVDPPKGHKEAFGMLYLAEYTETAAFEMGILRMMRDSQRREQVELQLDQPDPATGEMPLPLQTVMHTLREACLFVDLDHPSIFREFGEDLKAPVDQYQKWQAISLRVHEQLMQHQAELFAPVIGVTYASQHRGSTGRNFAVFDAYIETSLWRGQARAFDAERELSF